MSLKKIAAIAVAGLMSVGVVASVAQDFVAPTTAEEAMAAREMLMKQNGALLKSAGALTGAEAETAMQSLIDNYTHIPAVFPEGSNIGDSEALPAIWENWDAFTAIAETGRAAAADGLAAAQAGDADAYGAAIKAIGATCGTCHKQYRS
ncbi:cytochrome c [Devosia sp. J2-20]|uniref:c-type cytochrome n=1 Tax=Devosia sp. J2-20 TaxID=3026161 RepID=UPI00249BF910|nr:cytochrome c [Devosia sp. J2-20]WDQ97871.1 cytochrome c [Devosia sp. J2-20]